MNLTILSLMGMLALTGVVVNDSLVLVDYINKKRAQGMALLEAVTKAGMARFRPVLLTSLTTFVGLMPLIFEKSTQAQFLIPMAVSLGFGIMFATFMTLFLIPVNYLILDLSLLNVLYPLYLKIYLITSLFFQILISLFHQLFPGIIHLYMTQYLVLL